LRGGEGKQDYRGLTSNKTFYSDYQTVTYSSNTSLHLQQPALPGNLWFGDCGLLLLPKRGKMLKLNNMAPEENGVRNDKCKETLSFSICT
jgi:hypothetical protein